MDAKPLLNYFSEYIDLNKEEQDFLISKVRYQKYLKGQYILQQGDICRYSNFIVSGCVKMTYIDSSGHEHIVLFGIKDWWVSDLGSFIDQVPADYNIQCIEPTEVIQFTKQNEEELMDKLPQVERLFHKKVQKAFVSAQRRIILNLSLTAKERYLLFKKQYPSIEQRIPQYMIASYLGITKEFFSKLKKELVSENLD